MLLKKSETIRTSAFGDGSRAREHYTKILIITQYFPPDLNGDVIRLLNIIKTLKELGYALTIVTAFPHYTGGETPLKYKNKLFAIERWYGIPVIRTFILPLPHKGVMNRFMLYLSFSLSSLVSIFLVRNVDVVWAFSQKFFSYISGIVFKVIHGTKLIVDFTDVWPEAIVNTGYMEDGSLIFNLVDLMFNIFFKLSDCIATLTDPMKKMLTLRGINPDKIVVLPNVVNLKEATPHLMDNVDDRFGGSFVVMYSGNLGPNYDFECILEAASMLRCFDDVLFVLRGRGEMKDHIVNYLKEEELDNVYLDERILSENDFLNYLNQADIFLLPMKKNPYPDASFPIKLLDYLSCGKPVVSYAEGFLRYLISYNKVGITIPPENPKELKKAIMILKNNSELREKMSINARRLAEEHFSYKILKSEIVKLFVLLMNGDA